ncbi:MAG: NUDIX hydrolase [Candidatus Bathyarchaeota archaeon]|nr:MAG: NUDIX hydrolase [Candidatus Bathyarchaeota archaeon]
MIGVFAIIPQRGKILLIRRGTMPFQDYWCPPGGVIDEGETAGEAVVRETIEETGIRVRVVEKLGDVTGPITGRNQGVYLCTPMWGRAEPSPPEVTDVRWVSFDELPSLPIPPFIRRFLDDLDLGSFDNRSGK